MRAAGSGVASNVASRSGWRTFKAASDSSIIRRLFEGGMVIQRAA